MVNFDLWLFQPFSCFVSSVPALGQMNPVVSVKVTLLKCKLEVYSAVLRIEAELRSLTYVIALSVCVCT